MNLKSIIVGAFVIAASVFSAAESDAQVNVRIGSRGHQRHYNHHRRPVVRERVVVRQRPVVRERVVVRHRQARPVVRERVVVHKYGPRRR